LIAELLTTAYLLVYIMMTDLQLGDENIKDACGWVLVGILFLALLISFLAILANIWVSLK
jgi:hypothetical protein